MDEAVNMFHHQFTGQSDGMLEVCRSNVPVCVVTVASL